MSTSSSPVPSGSRSGSTTTNRAPPVGGGTRATRPPWPSTMPLTTYSPSPVPPRSVPFQNRPKMRADWLAGTPGPSIGDRHHQAVRVLAHRDRDRPVPVAQGVLQQVVDDLPKLVRIEPHLGKVAAISTTKRSGSMPVTTLASMRRRTSVPKSVGTRRSSSRPASMRATSSSSAISRVNRSASLSTASSIRRRWSSVNRSHLFSSVEVNPLTPVSGDRSSWATVAIRSACSRSARSRASVPRKHTTTRSTGPPRSAADVGGGDQQIATIGQLQDPFNLAAAVESPPNGLLTSHQSRPAVSTSGSASASGSPISSAAGTPGLELPPGCSWSPGRRRRPPTRHPAARRTPPR